MELGDPTSVYTRQLAIPSDFAALLRQLDVNTAWPGRGQLKARSTSFDFDDDALAVVDNGLAFAFENLQTGGGAIVDTDEILNLLQIVDLAHEVGHGHSGVQQLQSLEFESEL